MAEPNWEPYSEDANVSTAARLEICVYFGALQG
jgi:hypothetical protein